jgi:plastocyanin
MKGTAMAISRRTLHAQRPVIAWCLAFTALAFLASAPRALGGDVVGTVRFAGPVPPVDVVRATTDLEVCGAAPRPAIPLRLGSDNRLADAVVFIAHERLDSWRVPAATFVMEQRGCEFVPRLLVIPPGATLEVRNSDRMLHNFHTLSDLNPRMNLAQRAGGRPPRVRFEQPEFVQVICDVHGTGFMRAWIVVAAHPYYAVTDANGRFRLPGIPQGPHTLAVWHERLGRVTVPVTVSAEGEVRLDILIPPTGDRK